MNDTITIQQATAFFLSYTLIVLALGFWLGRLFSKWNEKRLLRRIDRQKFEILMLDPKRSFNL